MENKFSTLQKAVVKLASNMHYTALPKNADVITFLSKHQAILNGCEVYLDLEAYKNVYRQTQSRGGVIKPINNSEKEPTYLFEYLANNKKNYLLIKSANVWWCSPRFKVIKYVSDNKPIYISQKTLFAPTVFISTTSEQTKHQEKEA